MTPTTPTNLPALLQRFFTDRLRAQLGASPHTVASYRDTFRLLLVFASRRLEREPSQLRLEDLDVALLGAFLDHLEHGRASTPKTRNTRLAAVRAFFRFVSYTEPACSLQCQQVLAIPNKRHERRPVEFSPRRKPRRSLPLRTRRRGLGAATAPCFSWRHRPAYATPSSAPSEAATWTSALAPTCAAPEREQDTLHPLAA